MILLPNGARCGRAEKESNAISSFSVTLACVGLLGPQVVTSYDSFRDFKSLNCAMSAPEAIILHSFKKPWETHVKVWYGLWIYRCFWHCRSIFGTTVSRKQLPKVTLILDPNS